MSTLVNKNVIINGRRTSMRLEPEMWQALYEICRMENVKIGRLCTMIHEKRGGASMTSATRIFIIAYFRALAFGSQAVSAGVGMPNSRYESTLLSKALSFRISDQPKPVQMPSYS